jgi:hypothetical protein
VLEHGLKRGRGLYIATGCHTKILPASIDYVYHFETQWLLEAPPALNVKRVVNILSTGCPPLLRMILTMNSTIPNNIKSFLFLMEGIFMRDIESRSGVYEQASLLEYNNVFISKLSQKFRSDLLPQFSETLQHKKKENCIDIDYGPSKLQQNSLVYNK